VDHVIPFISDTRCLHFSLCRLGDVVLGYVGDGVEDVHTLSAAPPSRAVLYYSDFGNVLDAQFALVSDQHVGDGLADRGAWIDSVSS
jgi:hypothetical protein